MAGALVVLAAGCGGTGVAAPGQADLAKGNRLFEQRCAACHTLAAAGAKGTIGPNLDSAAFGVRASGFDPSSFEAMVREQIAEPDPFGRMPANIVTGKDAKDVAAYVGAVAGAKLPREGR